VLPDNLKLQKRLADDDLIPALKHLTMSWQQPPSPVDKGSIGRTQVFDEVLAVLTYDAGVPSRYFGLGIVLVQIDIREYSAVGVPSTYICLDAGYRKLFAYAPASLYHQLRSQSHIGDSSAAI